MHSLSVFVQHRCRVPKCVITETAVASGVTNAVTSAVGVTSQGDDVGCSEYEKIIKFVPSEDSVFDTVDTDYMFTRIPPMREVFRCLQGFLL